MKQVTNYFLEQEERNRSIIENKEQILSLPPRVGTLRCYCLEEAKIYKELNANDEIEKNYPIEYWLTKSSE